MIELAVIVGVCSLLGIGGGLGVFFGTRGQEISMFILSTIIGIIFPAIGAAAIVGGATYGIATGVEAIVDAVSE